MLYHGTTIEAAKRAALQGVLPRSVSGATNRWGKAESLADGVYLTDRYGFYFGAQAATSTSDPASFAVLEIDDTALEPAKMFPDEDFLEQAMRRSDGIGGGAAARTAWYRAKMDEFANPENARLSLAKLGTVGHMGTVAPELITRVAVARFNMDDQMDAAMMLNIIDASITIAHCLYASDFQERLTAEAFEGKIASVKVYSLQEFLKAMAPKDLIISSSLQMMR